MAKNSNRPAAQEPPPEGTEPQTVTVADVATLSPTPVALEVPYKAPMETVNSYIVPGVSTLERAKATAAIVKAKADAITAELHPPIGETPVPGAVSGIAAPELPLADWRVTLVCPTPLTDHELTVKGHSEQQAWEAFCRHNGITDSIHPRTITLLPAAESLPV